MSVDLHLDAALHPRAYGDGTGDLNAISSAYRLGWLEDALPPHCRELSLKMAETIIAVR